MIPVRLQLKNFMSYGEGVPPLELAGVRLACLSGDNGNGKTALLDAMTWALFGECRAKSKEDVIRLGASECGVMLDFLVDGEQYRVRRTISRKSSGSLWELQVRRADNSLHPLSGVTQQETKEKIRALLRMDYDTFLSTAYLAQGRADEFSRATPNKRKEVLADILDLSRYDRLEEMAKEREKEAKERETDLTRTISGINAILENRDRYEMALESAKRQLDAATAERDRLQAERGEIAAAVDRLDVIEQRARNMEDKIADAQERNHIDQATLDTLLPRIARAQTLTEQASEVEAAYQRLMSRQSDVGRLESVFNRALELGRKCGDLERVIRAEETRLTSLRYQKQCQIEELERDIPTLATLESDIRRLQNSSDSFGDVDQQLAANEEARQVQDEQMAELKDDNAAGKHAESQLKQRLTALKSSSAPNCEYCGQSLPEAKRAGAIDQAETELRSVYERLALTMRDAGGVKAELAALKTAQDALLRTRQAKAEHLTQIRLLTQQVTRLQERIRLLPQAIAERDDLDAQLLNRDFLLAEQEQLAQLSAERERAEAAHAPLEAARAEVNSLSNAPRDLDALHAARLILETEPTQVGELQVKVTKRIGQIAVAEQQVLKARGEAADLPGLKRTLDALDVQFTGATVTVQRADREIGDWSGKLQDCAEQAQKKAVYEAELVEQSKQRDLFRELIGAFGKKGVQALIIENALPEIVGHANELLSKLSNDAMKVELKTTREARTKSAQDVETLDIIVSDEMGTRPYEMFSGGEAFRINFALRVALSRVLASRAGAPLQTLIVDEGFGTQDPRGREAMTDALMAIQEYFALILCITHIEEIKEAFPTRIEIIKGPNGSSFAIS